MVIKMYKLRKIVTKVAIILSVTITGCNAASDNNGNSPAVEESKSNSAVSDNMANSSSQAVEGTDSSTSSNSSKITYDNVPILSKEQVPYEYYEYQFEDVTFCFPKNWESQCIMETATDSANNEKILNIYQKNSYDVNSKDLLFSIIISNKPICDNNSNYRMFAYTNTHLYYVQRNECEEYSDDTNLEKDFCDMLSYIAPVIDSACINDENVNYKPYEYAIPATEFYSVNNMNLDIDIHTLYDATYDIYARHGYFITSPETNDDWYYQNYTSSKSWYEANKDFNKNELSDIEKENLNILNDKINAQKKEIHYSEMVNADCSVLVDIYGDGIDDNFKYYDNGPLDGKDYYFHPIFTVNDEIYDVWDYESWGVWMDDVADYCFVIDIDKQNAGKEVAILDYGSGNGEMTHLFAISKECLTYIGSVPGFFLYPDTDLSGLGSNDSDSSILTKKAIDFPEKNEVYCTFLYKYEKQLVEEISTDTENSSYSLVAKRSHQLQKEIDIFPYENEELNIHLSKNDTVRFLAINITPDESTASIYLQTETGLRGNIFFEKDAKTEKWCEVNSGYEIDELFNDLMH